MLCTRSCPLAIRDTLMVAPSQRSEWWELGRQAIVSWASSFQVSRYLDSSTYIVLPANVSISLCNLLLHFRTLLFSVFLIISDSMHLLMSAMLDLILINPV